ncbi:MAG: hypothetical protein WA840_04995 [Caulobacteraceae bacterium]
MLGLYGAVFAGAQPLFEEAFKSDPAGILSLTGLLSTTYLAMFGAGYFLASSFVVDGILILKRSWPELVG